LIENQIKPARPKDTFHAVLREVRKPRSASLFQQLAKKESCPSPVKFTSAMLNR